MVGVGCCAVAGKDGVDGAVAVEGVGEFLFYKKGAVLANI